MTRGDPNNQPEPNRPEPAGLNLAGLDRVGIRVLRNEVSGLVQRAAAGERIVITVDGRPMAQLGPLMADGEPTLDDLAVAGLLNSPRSQDELGPMTAPAALPADMRLERLLDQARGRL